VLVGAIGIPLILLFILLGDHIFLIMCVILSFFCMNEFYNLFEKPKKEPSLLTKWVGGLSFHKIVFLLISSLIVVCFYLQKFNFVFILYFIMFVYLIIDEVVKIDKHFEAIGSWMLSIVYISTPFGLLSLMDSNKFISLYGANYAIICLILVWVSDTFAFFGGKTFGKHLLAERISPKKTWEGSISGFTITLITGLLLKIFWKIDFSYEHVFMIAIIVGVFAQIGDLFESHLKRTVKVKDSSNLIPGHGGFLDRFDSILFSVPALYIYLYLRSIY
jgi:phosphatidate cytidylyltransferase